MVLYVSCAAVLILSVLFAGLMIVEPRTIWSGALFTLLMLSLAVTLLFALYRASDWLTTHVAATGMLIFLVFLSIGCILVCPLVLTALFFVEGIRVLMHEGIRLPNLLSILFAVVLFVCLVIWPVTGNPGKHVAGELCFAAAASVTAYGMMLLGVYALSAAFNLIHIKKRRNADYIVVLGAGLNGKAVTPLLAARIDKGIGLMQYNPDAVLILSGGQGPGEEVPESVAMAAYAMEKGVSANRIIMEPESVSTRENLLFSRRMMERRSPRILIVTTAYHVFRALILARKLGIRCTGYGAKTTWYFALNAFLREFAGYLSLTWKRHLFMAVILTVIVILVRLS